MHLEIGLSFLMPTLKNKANQALLLRLAFIMLRSLFLVNYKGASVRHSTAHPQNLTFCVNGPTCPINISRSFNVSKPGIQLRGTVCLLSSRDNIELIPTTAFHRWGMYLHLHIL